MDAPKPDPRRAVLGAFMMVAGAVLVTACLVTAGWVFREGLVDLQRGTAFGSTVRWVMGIAGVGGLLGSVAGVALALAGRALQRRVQG